MKEIIDPSRREFTLASALAVLSGVAITVSGCGGGGSGYGGGGGDPYGPGTPATPMTGDKVGAISTNHGHMAVITAARLTAPAAIGLDIRGSADHTHTVDLSADEIASIAADKQVSKLSTASNAGGQYGDHAHTVTFN